jgi:hypothetical protein
VHVAAENGASGEERVDVADVQHLADLGRAVCGREWHHERADAAGREPRDDPLVPVGEVQADPGPLADARRDHPLGQSTRALLGFAVRHASIGHHEEVAVTPRACGPVQRDRDRRRVAEVGDVHYDDTNVAR